MRRINPSGGLGSFSSRSGKPLGQFVKISEPENSPVPEPTTSQSVSRQSVSRQTTSRTYSSVDSRAAPTHRGQREVILPQSSPVYDTSRGNRNGRVVRRTLGSRSRRRRTVNQQRNHQRNRAPEPTKQVYNAPSEPEVANTQPKAVHTRDTSRYERLRRLRERLRARRARR